MNRLIEKINGVETHRKPSAPLESANPAPRLTASPFQVDHRGELVKEMRADAEILDQQAAELISRALALRLAADHLEAHPPE